MASSPLKNKTTCKIQLRQMHATKNAISKLKFITKKQKHVVRIPFETVNLNWKLGSMEEECKYSKTKRSKSVIVLEMHYVVLQEMPPSQVPCLLIPRDAYACLRHGEARLPQRAHLCICIFLSQGLILAFQHLSRRAMFSILGSKLYHGKLRVWRLALRIIFFDQTVYKAGKCPFKR